ncbi:uncharacterized protein TRUGW13939_10885 [Talaromyces rugulosus]|uniref:Uncharacterized protein n=1 Tax=Talaromyces rugulosus TaxID=121627 RepID=A0A7H8RBA5_TALRU|nr:uncharacterized protein TRUGW13939_10885 [Talaromyces rugulosus]QKX63714.1 hypothetical protein TRUGW13939_10885 [Talaromyces rugulosus]
MEDSTVLRLKRRRVLARIKGKGAADRPTSADAGPPSTSPARATQKVYAASQGVASAPGEWLEGWLSGLIGVPDPIARSQTLNNANSRVRKLEQASPDGKK